MTTGDDSYDFFDALERLDVIFEDFTNMTGLIRVLDEALGRPASAAQIDRAVDFLGGQRLRASEFGFSIARFIRGGRVVTQLRDVRGRFVASTDIIPGEPSSQRRRAGDIAAALARGAG